MPTGLDCEVSAREGVVGGLKRRLNNVDDGLPRCGHHCLHTLKGKLMLKGIVLF